jgi:hypothetical protein
MTNPGDTNGPVDHGTYTLTAAMPLTIPSISKGVIDWFTAARAIGRVFPSKLANTYKDRLRLRISKRFLRARRPLYRLKVVKRLHPPPPPTVTAVGVMDVGIGNCNMLLDQNFDPLIYYDIGLPLFFYGNSAPPGLRAAGWAGPILNNNTTGALVPVILSHWDWDHWRLGRAANMQNHPWLVPNQVRGPAANNFFLTLTNVQVYGGAAFTFGPDYTIYQCNPPGPAVGAFLLNNSGIALRMDILLPTADPNAHSLYLTGDANFTSLPFPVMFDTVAIVAVHHGSNNHGAAANLPAQAGGYAGHGRIAYSYGVRPNGNHPYGFPVPAAVAAYQAAGWTVENSTAEGVNINNAPPAVGNRGNIRVGNQTPLNAAYNATAFFAFPNWIN